MKPIGSVVHLVLLLFICSTTLANEYNEIASKLMQTQNCSFDINNYTLSYDNVEALRVQQLETIRNVQQITKNSANRLIQGSPNFETLLLTLRSGIRFGGGFYTSDDDIQLGTGPLNYRKSIHTTGDVLARFGQELNKMAEKFQVQAASNIQMPEWNQIKDSVDSLIRMFRRELPIAFTVMYGFVPNNSFQDSIEQLKRLADGLIGLANQWEAQLVAQKYSCERYLHDTQVVIDDTSTMDPKALKLEAFGEKSFILYDSIHSNQPFLNQIESFAKLPKSTEKLDQYAKMLKYLSTATLDMLDNLKSSSAESSRAPIYDHDSFMYYVKKVKNTLNQQLESHLSEHDKKLSNIIAKISQSTQFNRTSDVPQLLLVAKVLESLIHSKFVLQKYDAVVVALKPHVFPYAHLYLADADFNRNSTDIEYLVNSAVESLDTIGTNTKYNSYTFTQGFGSDYPCAPPPFYVWSNASAHALSKLLSGGSVNLKAYIRLSDPEMDAIKFRNVRFNLKTNNPALQQELDTSLEYFEITARHMGDSYYRYQGKYYAIKHEPLEILYSFRKDSDGTPTTSNEPFIKLQEESTHTLSPYAMWQIQLHPMYRAISFNSFDWLAKFKDQVYLELVGRGQFVESKKAVAEDLHLEKYYSEYCPVEDISAETADHESYQSLQIMKCRMSR